MIDVTVPRVPYKPEPVEQASDAPQEMDINGQNKGILRDEKGRVLPGTAPMNPGGRPKGTSITATLRDILEEEDPKYRKTFKELLVRKMIVKAINDGDHALARLIMNYVDGMPVQKIQGDVGINLNMGHILEAAARVRKELRGEVIEGEVIDYAQLETGTDRHSD